MRWMEIAWTNAGVAETAGPGATPQIIAYFRDAGRPDITSDEVSWCAAFVNACLSRGGVSLDAIPRSERLLARSCLKQGTQIEEPRVGCLAVITRGEPWQGHVVFVTGWTADKIKGLGGNQSNTVSEQWFDRRDVVGYRWPEAPAKPSELAVKGSRIAAASRRQGGDAGKVGLSGGSVPVMPAPAPPAAPSIDAIGQQASGFKGVIETFEGFATFAQAKWPWIAGGLAAYFLGRMAYDALVIAHARTQDANEGWSPVVPPQPREETADGVL